jgi:hypothetical protein
MRPLLTILSVLLVAAVPARGVDYAKIDRRLAKEPTYASKSPKFALLLFGPEAKLRVWVALDGDVVYLDRNGDGDLTAEGERFAKVSDCKDIDIADPDGKTRYVITNIGVYPDGDRPRAHLMVNVDIKGPVAYRQYCDAELRESPSKAAVAHFHGPLTAGPRTINWKLPPQLALTTGNDPTDLNACVGTMDAEHGCWVVVRSHHEADKSAFAEGICPVVDIEFPAQTPGGQAVKKRYALDKFC